MVKSNIQFLADCIEEDAKTYCAITNRSSNNIFYIILYGNLTQFNQIFEALRSYNSRQGPGAKINNADIVFGGNNPFFPLLVNLNNQFQSTTDKLMMLKEFMGENYQTLLSEGIERAMKANASERYLLVLKNYVSYLVNNREEGKNLSVEIMVFRLAIGESNLDSKLPSSSSSFDSTSMRSTSSSSYSASASFNNFDASQAHGQPQERVKRKESPSAFPDSQVKKIPWPEVGRPVSFPSMSDVDPIEKNKKKFFKYSSDIKLIKKNIKFLTDCIEKDAKTYCTILGSGSCNIFCNIVIMPWPQFNEIFDALRRYKLRQEPSSTINNVDVIFGGKNPFYYLFALSSMNDFDVTIKKIKVLKEFMGDKYQSLLLAGVEEANKGKREGIYISKLEKYLSNLEKYPELSIEVGVFRQAIAKINLDSNLRSLRQDPEENIRKKDQMGQTHDSEVKVGHAGFEKKSKRKQPGSETPSSSSSSASSSNVTDQFVKRKREAPLNKPASFFQSASPSQPQFKQPNSPLGASPFASSSSGFFPQASPQPKCEQSEPSSLKVTFDLWVKAVENLLNETFPFNPDGDNSKRNFYFGECLLVMNSPVSSNLNKLKKIYEKLALEKAQQSSLPASVPDYKGPH